MPTLSKSVFFSVAVVTAGSVLADPNDWVNPSYVLGSTKDVTTANARKTISSGAGTTAKGGPFTVSSSTAVKAPSNDVQDYLSWAPYHWPNCNWCSKGGRTHIATNSSDSNDTGDDASDDNEDPDSTDDTYDDYDDGTGYEDPGDSNGSDPWADPAGTSLSPRKLIRKRRADLGKLVQAAIFALDADFDTAIGFATLSNAVRDLATAGVYVLDPLPISLATNPLSTSASATASVSSMSSESTHQTTNKVFSNTAQAENPVKTQKGKATTVAKQTSSCTPSPTSSVAASATWTACPYVVRDGKLNSDVRMLHGVNAVNSVTQSVLYNALAYAFSKTPSYSKTAATYIDTFFLDPKTGMHPQINYGQLIRGPGQEQGQFLGILDFRGMVKVVNAIQLLKATGSSDWTAARDRNMQNWAQQYINWLQTNAIGKTASAAPNNHGSFYHNQLAALKMLVGDNNGAIAALSKYFSNQFKDQIAASGEQPFEAVRTRPYHYRCFNLEAMITNAKLGDQLGQNFWAAKSKYGATIQNALDYTMSRNPGKEDVNDILPHVAAVAAAYGDPSGKYAAFLQRTSPSYRNLPFFYYDQTKALTKSPAAKSGGKRSMGSRFTQAVLFGRDDAPTAVLGATTDNVTTTATSTEDGGTDVPSMTSASFPTPTIPFACPGAFALVDNAQLDDGLFVTCEQLKPLYGYVQ